MSRRFSCMVSISALGAATVAYPAAEAVATENVDAVEQGAEAGLCSVAPANGGGETAPCPGNLSKRRFGDRSVEGAPYQDVRWIDADGVVHGGCPATCTADMKLQAENAASQACAAVPNNLSCRRLLRIQRLMAA